MSTTYLDQTSAMAPETAAQARLRLATERLANARRTRGRKHHESVYFIVSLEGPERVKVGRSTVPVGRARTIQASSPVRVRLLCHVDAGGGLENELLAAAVAFRVWGEWHDAGAMDVFATVLFRHARRAESLPPRVFR